MCKWGKMRSCEISYLVGGLLGLGGTFSRMLMLRKIESYDVGNRGPCLGANWSVGSGRMERYQEPRSAQKEGMTTLKSGQSLRVPLLCGCVAQGRRVMECWTGTASSE